MTLTFFRRCYWWKYICLQEGCEYFLFFLSTVILSDTGGYVGLVKNCMLLLETREPDVSYKGNLWNLDVLWATYGLQMSVQTLMFSRALRETPRRHFWAKTNFLNNEV